MYTTDGQDLELKAGNSVNVEAVYGETDLPTLVFQVEIPESGAYQAFVTGVFAKGGVHIVKESGW